MRELPPWADADLSDALPALALAGETQAVEFKREFPKQISDLAKEIAGFATSNAGTIYVGVDDDGAIVGIDAGPAARASLVQRIQGLCAGVVRPAITPRLQFADVDGKCVLAIKVPKGVQPIYWCGSIPYLRQVTAARPMSPDEVVEAVRAWDGAEEEITPDMHFLHALSAMLVDSDIAIADTRIADFHPWPSDVGGRLDDIADLARDLSERAPHALTPTIEPLEQLAETLETLADRRPNERPRIEYVAAQDEAENLVRLLRARWLGPGRFGKRYAEAQIEKIRTSAQRLKDALTGANGDPAQENALKQSARDCGLELLRAASQAIGAGDQRHLALWDIAMGLRAIVVRDTARDGAEGLRQFFVQLTELNDKLQNWIENHAAPAR